MKNPLDYIQVYPHRTKQILGITLPQFKDLLKQAQICHQNRQKELESRKIRINQKGGGRKPKLNIAEQVCLCLFYLRQMPTFEVLGLQFGVSKTEANDTFHYWLKILRNILPASLLEQVENHQSDYELVLEVLTEFELIVDSMEQSRERPSDNQEQKKYFSGKKKQHTFKSQFITLPKGKDIVDVKIGERGPVSDISLLRTQQEKFADIQKFQGDKAYIGSKNTTTPYKKPKKGKLTEQQKVANKKISSNRIFVEHVIRLIKIFRIAQQRFPLSSPIYQQVILTICGLVRLRIGALVLPVSSS
jgi:hypothetical protein